MNLCGYFSQQIQISFKQNPNQKVNVQNQDRFSNARHVPACHMYIWVRRACGRAGVRDPSPVPSPTSHYPRPIRAFRIPAQFPTMPAQKRSSPHCGDWNWGRTGSGEVGSDEPSNCANASEIGQNWNRRRADRIDVPRLTEGGRKERRLSHVDDRVCPIVRPDQIRLLESSRI